MRYINRLLLTYLLTYLLLLTAVVKFYNDGVIQAVTFVYLFMGIRIQNSNTGASLTRLAHQSHILAVGLYSDESLPRLLVRDYNRCHDRTIRGVCCRPSLYSLRPSRYMHRYNAKFIHCTLSAK